MLMKKTDIHFLVILIVYLNIFLKKIINIALIWMFYFILIILWSYNLTYSLNKKYSC